MKNDPILLVEDDRDIQENLRDFLESEGFRVHSAFNGQEALDYLQLKKPVQVILLDLMMPVMDGYEFLEKYFSENQSHRDFKRAEIIVLSAAPDLEKVAQKRGVAFVKKPIDLDLLLAKISST